MFATGQGNNHVLILGASAVPPLAATIIAARAESGPKRATWDKRRLGLAVAAQEGTPHFGRALAHNVVKIFVPWNLGHLVAFAGAWGAFERNAPGPGRCWSRRMSSSP